MQAEDITAAECQWGPEVVLLVSMQTLGLLLKNASGCGQTSQNEFPGTSRL